MSLMSAAVVLTLVCLCMQPEMLNRERVLVDEKSKNACEGHPDAATAGSGYGTGGNTGYGSQGTNNSSTY